MKIISAIWNFKVAGSQYGITALQMDIKIEGIDEKIMEQALNQARQARLHILEQMNNVLPSSREQVSSHAPRFEIMQINVNRIRDLIGKGGVNIRSIIEATGASIDVDDNGQVKLYASDEEALQEAKQSIIAATAEAEIGKVYVGKVAKIVDFGAFVTILPGQDGLVHVSQINNEHVKKVEDYLSAGQEVSVKVLDVDERGRIKLSMKDVEQNTESNLETSV